MTREMLSQRPGESDEAFTKRVKLREYESYYRTKIFGVGGSRRFSTLSNSTKHFFTCVCSLGQFHSRGFSTGRCDINKSLVTATKNVVEEEVVEDSVTIDVEDCGDIEFDIKTGLEDLKDRSDLHIGGCYSKIYTILGYTSGYSTKIGKYTIKFLNKARHYSTKHFSYNNSGKFGEQSVCDLHLNTNASYKDSNLDYVIFKTIDEASIKTAMQNFAKAAVNDKLVGVILYDYKIISSFLTNFEPSFQISKQSLSNYKKIKFVFKSFIITKKVISFLDYIKTFFPYFDDKAFLSLSKVIGPDNIKHTRGFWKGLLKKDK